MRIRFGFAVIAMLAGCHAFAPDNKPMTPSAMCQSCCSQALDACKLDISQFPAALCPPKYRECTTACESGDENEICVVQTNRQVAATAPKPIPAVAKVATEPEKRGECDNKGIWNITVATTNGEARGCAALDSIPKQVSFRIGRRHDAYVLYDLTPVPGWTDAFSVQNNDHECIVTLQRDNRTEVEKPRALAVKLTERDRAVSGTLKYEEANQPAGCSLDAPVTGNVVPPPPDPSRPSAPVEAAPASATTHGHGTVPRSKW